MEEWKILSVLLIFACLSFNLNLIQFSFFILFLILLVYSLSPLNFGGMTELILWDTLSLSLIIMSLWIVYLMLMTTPQAYKNKSNSSFYYFLVIIFIPILFYAFSLNSLLFFYIMFEGSLIPTFLIITGWGYQVERVQSVFYFMLYTIFASLPFLLVLSFMGMVSLSYLSLLHYSFSGFMNLESAILGVVLTLAFLVKMPLYLFHLWLPKAHVEAPVVGSMILAGALLKLGGYGLLRIMGMYMSMTFYLNSLFWLSSFSMLIVGVVCVKLTDMKLLIAYSSVAHMAMALLGVYTLYISGSYGAFMMFLSHGICSSGMFYFIGVTYNFSQSRSTMINKGLMNLAKIYIFYMFMLFMPNIAVPLTMNLFSEVYILFSLVNFSLLPLGLVVIGMFLVAYFTIMLFSYICHGVSLFLLMNLFKLKFDSFLTGGLHFFILNTSFFLISYL